MLNPRLQGLSCFACDQSHAPTELQGVCRACGMPLRVDLDLADLRLSRADVARREPSLWRYIEVLPLSRERAVTLIEGWTPLVPAGERVFVKDESRNPTGSFKARGMSAAVSMARWLGARKLSAPSAGNAAGALAAYGAAAGLRVLVAMPEDTPRPFVEECLHYGARVELVAGTIADAGRWLREHLPADVFDVSTLREPYRIEGKKTLLYELVEQLDGVPDVIVYPTGGGTGLVGMWKALAELESIGWTDGRRPRFVSVQAAGCAPIVEAFERRAPSTAAWPDPETTAYGLRVPTPIGGFLCLRALAETGGIAVAIDEDALHDGARRLSRATGIDVCPEGGAAWVAFERLRANGWIRESDRVVVFNTGTGLKYRA